MIQPGFPAGADDDLRHAVVDALHVFIRGAGNDYATVVAPQSGKGKKRTVRKLEIVGLPSFPFVEAIGGNEAPVSGQQILEHRAFGQCFGPGVDDGRAGAEIFKPPDAFLSLRWMILRYDGDLLCGRNIVSAEEEGREFNTSKIFEHLLPAFGLCKTTAHKRSMLSGRTLEQTSNSKFAMRKPAAAVHCVLPIAPSALI